MSGVSASWKNAAGRFTESGQRTGGLIGTLNSESFWRESNHSQVNRITFVNRLFANLISLLQMRAQLLGMFAVDSNSLERPVICRATQVASIGRIDIQV